jgi:hypothetical protein
MLDSPAAIPQAARMTHSYAAFWYFYRSSHMAAGGVRAF